MRETPSESRPPRRTLERDEDDAIDATASDRYQPEVYEPSARWEWIYDRFFSHVQVDEQWEPTVRAASERGLVVYVARSLSFLDFLCLDYLTKKHGLPLVRFCNDVGMSVVEPFGRGSRRLRLKAQIPEDEALTECVAQGHSALLFLRRPPSMAKGGSRKGDAMDTDLIRTLVDLQRTSDRPIQIVPQTFVWTKRPPNKERSFTDLLFGPSEWPGKLRMMSQFLVNSRNAMLRTGKPFCVQTFLEEHPDLNDAQAADSIRYALLRRMERERALVLGPAKKTATRIQNEILRSPRVRSQIEAAARDADVHVEEIEADARAELDKLCAQVDPTVLDLFHHAVDALWNRIYDGLIVDQEGLERVREAARRGPLILVPSHKSHVDYLILSDVLYVNGMAPPLIAAGENLSFFPLGPILRRSGAFFIKRSFKGKKLYPQLVDAYIRRVLLEGHNIEVFVEGGRSRTGKLLPPKLGILSMIVDAALKLKDREISFVPVSIGYERIIEGGTYEKELAGADKEPESIQGLLGARKVLRSRYGRLYLKFGEIFSFDDLRGEARTRAGKKLPMRAELSPPQRRALVQRVAHRITYEINRVTIVTPAALTATVLLTNRRRGIAYDDLVLQARVMVRVLARLGAPFVSPVVDEAGELRDDAIRETVRLFEDARMVRATPVEIGKEVAGERRRKRRRGDSAMDEVIFSVPDERRVALEYHKNTVLHFFVPSALIASSLMALGGDASLASLRERVQQLSRIFKFEFMYRADADFDEIFSDALDGMLEAGEVVRDDELIRRGSGDAGRLVATYAEMLKTYFEGYRIVFRSAASLGDEPVLKKDWCKNTLAVGRRLYFAGDVTLAESVALAKVENALAILHDQGLIRTEGDKLRGGSILSDAGPLEALDRLFEEHLSM